MLEIDTFGGSATFELLQKAVGLFIRDSVLSWYGNFDMISGRFSRVSQRYTTPRAPGDVLYLVPMRMGMGMGMVIGALAIRCRGRFTCLGLGLIHVCRYDEYSKDNELPQHVEANLERAVMELGTRIFRIDRYMIGHAVADRFYLHIRTFNAARLAVQ